MPESQPSASRRLRSGLTPQQRGLIRRGHLMCAGAVVALAIACQPQTPDSSTEAAAFDTTATRASIDSLAANVMRAEEAGDAELFATTWASDGIMTLPGKPPVFGRDSIVAYFRRRPPLPPGAKMTIHPTELQILSPQWAYVFGVDSLTYTPQGATAPVHETSTFLVVLKKTSEGWQSYREVLSANQP
jgi:uncharacterized protein (TIGR02246 family)